MRCLCECDKIEQIHAQAPNWVHGGGDPRVIESALIDFEQSMILATTEWEIHASNRQMRTDVVAVLAVDEPRGAFAAAKHRGSRARTARCMVRRAVGRGVGSLL